MTDNLVIRHVTTTDDVRACQTIRLEVFVSGQGVPEQLELEFEDESLHFLATNAGLPLGTGRLRPVDVYIKFERVGPHNMNSTRELCS
jgi:hypothetical protein